MAGPAPKRSRQRRNVPERGDWVTLTDPAPDPEPLPESQIWSPRTQRAWDAWWADPVSSQWTVADRDLLIFLAEVHERWVSTPKASVEVMKEVRQLRDLLGLTPKGRQDRRWQVAEGTDAEVTPLPTPEQRERRVRAVEV